MKYIVEPKESTHDLNRVKLFSPSAIAAVVNAAVATALIKLNRSVEMGKRSVLTPQKQLTAIYFHVSSSVQADHADRG